ncbi:protein kinase [Atopobiaceae bacterium 24-176]
MRELSRRSDHDATLLMSDRTGRLYVEKLVPAPVANAQAWHGMEGLSHPALARVWSVDEEPWGMRVLTDYVAGPTLEELVGAQGALNRSLAVQLVLQTAQGAGLLHSRGIVHRDLSCSNIVAGDDGACVVDAGIARVQSAEGKGHDTVLLGTRGFAAPEQYGFAETSPRTDVYALGRLLGYLLTGISPTSPIFEEALGDPAVVPPMLRALIDRACSLSPADRPADGNAFAAELAAATAASPKPLPAPAQATPRPAELSRWRRTAAKAVTVVGCAFFALMATSIFLEPTQPGVPVFIWRLQALSIGLLFGLLPGLFTRWLLLRQRCFASVRRPMLLWLALLFVCFCAMAVALSWLEGLATPVH